MENTFLAKDNEEKHTLTFKILAFNNYIKNWNFLKTEEKNCSPKAEVLPILLNSSEKIRSGNSSKYQLSETSASYFKQVS